MLNERSAEPYRCGAKSVAVFSFAHDPFAAAIRLHGTVISYRCKY